MIDRREHQCHYDGCDSEARWHAKVALHCIGIGRDRMFLKCATSLKVCDRHKNIPVEWILSDTNKQNIARGLIANSFPPPDFSSAKVEMEPIYDVQPSAQNRSGILKCDRLDCVLPAQYQIGFKLWKIGERKSAKPMRVLTGLCVCNRHRKELTREDLFSTEGKAKILAAMTERGFPMPDFKTGEIEYAKLAGGKLVDPAAFAAGHIRPVSESVL